MVANTCKHRCLLPWHIAVDVAHCKERGLATADQLLGTSPDRSWTGKRLTPWVGAVDMKRNRCYDYIFHIEIRCCYEAPASSESIWLVSL